MADYELSTGGGLCGVKYVNTVSTVSAQIKETVETVIYGLHHHLVTWLKPGVNERRPMTPLPNFCKMLLSLCWSTASKSSRSPLVVPGALGTAGNDAMTLNHAVESLAIDVHEASGGLLIAIGVLEHTRYVASFDDR